MPKSQTTIKKTNKNKTPDDPQIPSQSSKPHELQGTEIRRRVLLCWATRVSSFSEARQAPLGSVSSSGMGGHQASPSSGFGAVVFLLRRGEFSVSVINIVLSTGKSGHPAHAVSAVCQPIRCDQFSQTVQRPSQSSGQPTAQQRVVAGLTVSIWGQLPFTRRGLDGRALRGA